MTQRQPSSDESLHTTEETTAASGDTRFGRRRVLAALGVGMASTVAGCTGTEDPTEMTAGTPAASDTPTASDSGTTIETPTASDTPETSSTDSSTPTVTETPDAQTVNVRSVPEYGEILVGPDGMSLYMFDRDTQDAGESACYDDCEGAWPPLIDDDPTAASGVSATLSTFERQDGSMQVTANGWPLYYYTPDEQPGDVAGQAAGDVWWLLAPDGSVIRESATATPTDANQAALSSPIELDAQPSAWIGQSPAAIEGVENPTLRLQIGREYELTIVGVDSTEHELKIEDGDGEDVVESEDVEAQGERATVQFTADESLRSYYCDYHESSMQGLIELVE